MTSAQTSTGSLPWDMAEWDPGNEPRHRAKERFGRMDKRNKEVNSSSNERKGRRDLNARRENCHIVRTKHKIR